MEGRRNPARFGDPSDPRGLCHFYEGTSFTTPHPADTDALPSLGLAGEAQDFFLAMLAALPPDPKRALFRRGPHPHTCTDKNQRKKEPSKLAMVFLAGWGSVSDSPIRNLCFGAKRLHKWHPCNIKSGVKRPTTAQGISARRPQPGVHRPRRASCPTPLNPTSAKILACPQWGRRWCRGGGAVATGLSRELLYSFVFSSISASDWLYRPPI